MNEKCKSGGKRPLDIYSHLHQNTTKPQETAFPAEAGAISYLIDGSLAFVDDDKCQIRCPFEEDLFQKELDSEIQLKWNVSDAKSLQIEYGDSD